MLASSRSGTNVFIDQYRFADGHGHFKVAKPQALDAGFFRLGRNAVCYGRASEGVLQPHPRADLSDILQYVGIPGNETILPFDPDETIDNLRCERYVQSGSGKGLDILSTVVRNTYYLFRPFMPVRFRKHLQRMYLKGWDRIPFPGWPVDCTVENVFEELLTLTLQSQRIEKLPFVWFWPDGYSACSILTHDIETEAGRNFALRLADMEAAFNLKSSFQIVPEERYEVPAAFLDSLRARGCEVNLHGLNHDGQLFRDRREFLRQVVRINKYAAEYGAAGFRSPVMYRNLEWFSDLEFSYDMSVPNVAHLEAQRGGCCTVMPYFIGNLVELPLTTTQDYALFHVLKDWSIALWKRQIELVTAKHGLVSFNIHPDYMLSDRCRGVYLKLLEYLAQVCADQHIWLPLPGEVDQWWRRRSAMRVVKDGAGFRVTGPFSERAVLAYASLEDGRVVYEVSKRGQESKCLSA